MSGGRSSQNKIIEHQNEQIKKQYEYDLKNYEFQYGLEKDDIFVLKFKGNTPSFLVNKQLYDYEGIMQILNSPDWTQED